MADGQTTALVTESSAALRDRAGAVMLSTHGLAPRSLAELMDFGQLMAKAGPMIGKAFRDAPGSCIAVTMQAMRWNMDPFAVSQKAYVTGESVAYEAQLVNAVVLSNAPLARRPIYTFSGDGTKRRCKVSIFLRGEPDALEYETPETMPKGNSPLWTKDPDQQLTYYAIRAWARRHMPELLMGVYTPDELQDAGIVGEAHIVGEYDQRPANERGGVIGGKAGKDAFDAFAERMFETEDADALEIVFDEAEKANLSQNRMFALSEYYEACKEAHENGRDLPNPPLFAEAPPPSPFEPLKAEGEAVDSVDAYNVWRVKIKPALPLCKPEECAELETLFRSLHAKYAPKKTTTESAGGAGGRTDEDAGKAAAESGGAEPGGEAPPASESVFETLKQECLACLTDKAPRRALNAWAKKRDGASLADEERADLDKIEANVRGELSK